MMTSERQKEKDRKHRSTRQYALRKKDAASMKLQYDDNSSKIKKRKNSG